MLYRKLFKKKKKKAISYPRHTGCVFPESNRMRNVAERLGGLGLARPLLLVSLAPCLSAHLPAPFAAYSDLHPGTETTFSCPCLPALRMPFQGLWV